MWVKPETTEVIAKVCVGVLFSSHRDGLTLARHFSTRKEERNMRPIGTVEKC
jgi:hypothetical protein